jgi:Ca-activated chloride channel family protein
MNNASVMTSTVSTRPAGLVSVDGRTYPLKSSRIMARAEGGVSATTLTQTYGNPYEEPLEVLYTLPLPASGAVIGYAIRLGQKLVRGEVRRREEAREEYRKALLEGRTAALLEQDRADTFTQKLGCLPPGETVDVEIEVLQPLIFLPADHEEAARWEYRFPTVAGVRYEGAPGRVPDSDRLDADRAGGPGTPVRLEATLVVNDGPASSVRPHAPGREVDLADRDGGVCITLRERMKLDRDLVIRWSAAKSEVGVRIVEGKGLPGDDGRYLLITLTPPAAVTQALARDLTILIDASGSMSGKPLERAKIVAEELLCSLDPGDRFEILAFASSVQRLGSRPVEANENNVREALAAMRRIEADGSTEMTQAIVEALAPLRRDSQRQVILISDGYIGFESEVIGEVLNRLVPGARLHAVGIGAAPNRTLTRGVARVGRGVEILVGDDDDARAASRRLLQATVRPVLADVELKGTALISLAPERPQDVLQGQPLVLLAEITATGGTLEIMGKQAGKSPAWIRRMEIPGAGLGGDAASPSTTLPLGALFGREAIEDIELRFAAAGRSREAGEFEAKIEKLGLRHRIASRKTSLVAISEDPTVDPKDPRRRERLAVDLPAEVSAEGAGLASPVMMSQATPMLLRVSAPMAFHSSSMEMDLSRMKEDSADEEARCEYAPADEYDMESPRLPVDWSGQMPGLEIFDARVLSSVGPMLIFEFEVPVPGFMLPGDGDIVHVCFSDGMVCDAVVQGEETSPLGPHHQNFTIRMALKLADQYSWQHDEAQITWHTPVTGEVTLHIALR